MTFAPIPWLLAISMMMSTCAWAVESQEHAELALITQQFDAIQLLAKRARTASASASIDTRYRFDYPQLTHDLSHIRQGIQDYLAPSRAQPNLPTPLSGRYREDVDEEALAHAHD